MHTIGKKIQMARETMRLTQKEVADKLSMSVAGYGKIERDETQVTFEKLEKISEIIGLPVNSVIDFDEKGSVHIYNNNQPMQNPQQGEFHQYGLSNNERKLYEDKIRLLEELLRVKK